LQNRTFVRPNAVPNRAGSRPEPYRHASDDRPLLRHLEPRLQGALFHVFLTYGPRRGLTDPAGIVSAVQSALAKSIRTVSDDGRLWNARAMLAALVAYPDEALQCADCALAHEQRRTAAGAGSAVAP